MPRTAYNISGLVRDTDGTTNIDGAIVRAINTTTGDELPLGAESRTQSDGSYVVNIGSFPQGWTDADIIEVKATFTAGREATIYVTVNASVGTSSGQNITLELTYVYTTPEKVARLLGIPAFTNSTNVTLNHVIDLIKRAQDDIDSRTNHAWRNRRSYDPQNTDDYEWHPIKHKWRPGAGIPIFLNHTHIRSFDEFGVWNGSSYDNYITGKTEGRASDWWLENTEGILWIKSIAKTPEDKKIRVRYRYGEKSVPKDIEDVCTKIVVIDLMISDSRTLLVPGGEARSSLSIESQIKEWRHDVERTLSRYHEPVLIVP